MKKMIKQKKDEKIYMQFVSYLAQQRNNLPIGIREQFVLIVICAGKCYNIIMIDIHATWRFTLMSFGITIARSFAEVGTRGWPLVASTSKYKQEIWIWKKKKTSFNHFVLFVFVWFMYLQWWWQLLHNLPCGEEFKVWQATPQFVQQPPLPVDWAAPTARPMPLDGVVRPPAPAVQVVSVFEFDWLEFAFGLGGVCWRLYEAAAAVVVAVAVAALQEFVFNVEEAVLSVFSISAAMAATPVATTASFDLLCLLNGGSPNFELDSCKPVEANAWS